MRREADGNPRLFKVAMNSAPTAPVTPAMATTGALFTFVSILFAHDLVQMMRSFDYARTPPEPPEGLVLVVVLVVADIMGPDL